MLKKAFHRLENISSSEHLIVVEVQEGIYLEEDDIVRIEDDYARYTDE
jgi:mannose-1-phosphate guanylyltransferase/mannose-6-phosphate isomerase